MLSQIIGLLLRGLIRFYQLMISPLLGNNCRFEPSCSNYAAEAVARHGPWRGTLYAVWRVLRCNPWGGSGYDPVPEKIAHGDRGIDRAAHSH
ncbi:MAG: membrane protein insertion efficiency factor YidD [Stellaceae bacterium]